MKNCTFEANPNSKKMNQEEFEEFKKKAKRTTTAILIAATATESIVRPEERNFHTHMGYETPYNNQRIGLSVYNISAPIYTEYPTPPFIQLASLL